MTDLSILIPSRNEMFLKNTIEDILAHMEADTEIIAVLDGQWAEPPIHDHPRVTLVYFPEAIGQRAACNAAARISTATYVMKVDAHCAFDQGFDVKLLADMRDDFTVVPIMRNLHAFDWVCKNGHHRYQGPSGVCTECGEETTMEIVWIAKTNPQSTSYCFDSTPHFQYFNQYKSRTEGDLTETMSLQGSCWLLTRQKYFELELCDETWGSWGSMGIEVAVKTWLSGGSVLCNHKTWYAHMFRTQGGDFGFPFPLSGTQVKSAQNHARDMLFANNWKGQKKPLSWLLGKFWPVPGWTEEDLKKIGVDKKVVKGIVYYSDSRLDPAILALCQKQLLASAGEIPIVSCTLKKMDFGMRNIHFPHLKRGAYAIFKQILAGLEHSKTDVIYLCEHDILYHSSHFEFTPPSKDCFYYNTNVWRVRYSDGHAVWTDDLQQVSGLVAHRELLLDFVVAKIKEIEEKSFDGHYEPSPRENFQSKYPNLDIRHNGTMTRSKWSPEEFRNPKYAKGWKETDSVDGWGNLFDVIYTGSRMIK